MAGQATETSPLIEEPRKKGDVLATLRLGATSGAGLVADGYDLQVVNLVMAIMAHTFPDKMGPGAKSFAATTTLVGVIVGQVTFGALADVIGRKLASILTASLTIVGAALSACVVDTTGFSIAMQLGLCRLLLGLGIGGEYPLSAAIGKEAEGKRLICSRSQLLCFNMFLYNCGAVFQALFVTIMLVASVPLAVIWRVALAGGVVPSLVAVSLRFLMEEPEARAQERRAAEELRDGRAPGYFTNLASQVGSRWTIMLGACLSWFLFNFTAYGHGAFASLICDRLLGSEKESDIVLVKRDAVFSLIMGGLNVLGTLIGIALDGRLSLRTIQANCFLLMAVPLWIIGALNGSAQSGSSPWLAVLYMFCVFMMPFVGITTYLVPTESFPASARGTCVGIAAASGKLGGVVGTALFPIWEHRYGLNMVLVTSGCVSLMGAFVTLLLTPDTRPSQKGHSQKET